MLPMILPLSDDCRNGELPIVWQTWYINSSRVGLLVIKLASCCGRVVIIEGQSKDCHAVGW